MRTFCMNLYFKGMNAYKIFSISFIALVLVLCLAAADSGDVLKVLFTEGAPLPIGPYSQGVKSGGQIYLSGQIGMLPSSGKLVTGGIKEEARQALKNLDAVLKAGGCTSNDVVKCTIYLSNMNDFALFNEVYGEYFSSWKPARETVGISALPAGACVEISAIARIPR
jgi:2-iminobutanoate/2-iminopropanoate deaminase